MSQERQIYNKSVKRRLEKVRAKEAMRAAREARMRATRRAFVPSDDDRTVIAILAGLNSATIADVREVMNQALTRGRSHWTVRQAIRRLIRNGMVERIGKKGVEAHYTLTAKGLKENATCSN